jgi:hypothetical protein
MSAGGTKSGEHVGALFIGRKSTGTLMLRPILVQAGRSPRADDRSGDYSATTIDPNDNSFRTIQEYSTVDSEVSPPSSYIWGIWVTQIRIPLQG